MSRVSYFLQWCFSRWTDRNPYYEILRAHQQYARDCYGAQNNLGLRCKRHQKTWFMPFWCDGSFRLLSGQNVTDSMWAIVGNEKTTHGSGHRVNWCYFLFAIVLYGVQDRKTRWKFYFFVVSKSSRSGWENTLVSISGFSGIWPSCSSWIKPKSNGYKRDVVNTSI